MAKQRRNLRERPIFCHHCGERCGTEWVEEGFQWRNGPGELYADEVGNWHCSEACLKACSREISRRPPVLLLLLTAVVLLAIHLLVLRACAR